ncbi:MAG: hypothetical protein ACFB3T_13405 [Geminicoccaceae bacterium]
MRSASHLFLLSDDAAPMAPVIGRLQRLGVEVSLHRHAKRAEGAFASAPSTGFILEGDLAFCREQAKILRAGARTHLAPLIYLKLGQDGVAHDRALALGLDGALVEGDDDLVWLSLLDRMQQLSTLAEEVALRAQALGLEPGSAFCAGQRPIADILVFGNVASVPLDNHHDLVRLSFASKAARAEEALHRLAFDGAIFVAREDLSNAAAETFLSDVRRMGQRARVPVAVMVPPRLIGSTQLPGACDALPLPGTRALSRLALNAWLKRVRLHMWAQRRWLHVLPAGQAHLASGLPVGRVLRRVVETRQAAGRLSTLVLASPDIDVTPEHMEETPVFLRLAAHMLQACRAEDVTGHVRHGLLGVVVAGDIDAASELERRLKSSWQAEVGSRCPLRTAVVDGQTLTTLSRANDPAAQQQATAHAYAQSGSFAQALTPQPAPLA